MDPSRAIVDATAPESHLKPTLYRHPKRKKARTENCSSIQALFGKTQFRPPLPSGSAYLLSPSWSTSAAGEADRAAELIVTVSGCRVAADDVVAGGGVTGFATTVVAGAGLEGPIGAILMCILSNFLIGDPERGFSSVAHPYQSFISKPLGSNFQARRRPLRMRTPNVSEPASPATCTEIPDRP